MTPRNLPEPQLSTAEVAGMLGVKPVTVSSYHHHGRMPKPDGRTGRTPWWWLGTITAWQASRRGQAWRRGQDGPHDA